MKTEWVITRAYPAAGDDGAVGVVGPRGAALTARQIAGHPDAKRFRLFDDDDTLYYEGYLVGGDELAPLDDFGEPNAGCTGEQVLEDGEWKWL